MQNKFVYFLGVTLEKMVTGSHREEGSIVDGHSATDLYWFIFFLSNLLSRSTFLYK